MTTEPSLCPDEISASFRQEYDGTIHLAEAQDAYLKIRHLPPEAVGKEIKDWFVPEETRRMAYYLGSYQGDLFRIHYVQELEDGNWWSVQASIRFPEMRCTAVPLRRWEPTLEKNTPEHEITGFLMAEEQDGQLVILEQNELFSRLFPKDLTTLPTGSPLAQILKQCLQRDQCREYCGLHPETHQWLHWSFMSAAVGARHRVFLTVRALPDKTPFHRQRPFTPTEELFDHYFAAVGTLQRRQGGSFAFCDLNPCLGELLQKKAISREALLQASAFQSAVEQGVMSHGFFRFDEGFAQGITYLMSAVPVLSSEGIQEVMVYILPVEPSAVIDYERFRNLTLREGNVVRLALRGLDNRDIGRALRITEGTVKRELFSCYRKLEINSKIELYLDLFGLRE